MVQVLSALLERKKGQNVDDYSFFHSRKKENPMERNIDSKECPRIPYPHLLTERTCDKTEGETPSTRSMEFFIVVEKAKQALTLLCFC